MTWIWMAMWLAKMPVNNQVTKWYRGSYLDGGPIAACDKDRHGWIRGNDGEMLRVDAVCDMSEITAKNFKDVDERWRRDMDRCLNILKGKEEK